METTFYLIGSGRTDDSAEALLAFENGEEVLKLTRTVIQSGPVEVVTTVILTVTDGADI